MLKVKGNTGLHCAKLVEEYGSPGAYLKKRSIYNPHKRIDSFIYSNSYQEQIVTLNKLWQQHWALLNLPKEFKVISRNDWDPHPINIDHSNFLSIKHNYIVLAEALRGPQIAEYEKCLCVQFDIAIKYRESVIVLSNFINKYSTEIYVLLN